MVRGALLALAALALTVPAASAHASMVDAIPAGPDLQAIAADAGARNGPNLPSQDCIGLAGGDWYVQYEDYPGGGFRVFVGAPVPPILPLLPEVVGLPESPLTGSSLSTLDVPLAPGGTDWVGVGAFVMGPGCEVGVLKSLV